ncbi:DNA cytosine methyltransferase [Pseudomonas sp. 18058]|uniref:DNA cytosine methyltransferase n=1 Tax=Pseudomonas sp. 18058 TaxID=2681406 RepID=UPI002115BF61|nr:DNA cytosine methyltransferase [Pseudomonas sp. 18058]
MVLLRTPALYSGDEKISAMRINMTPNKFRVIDLFSGAGGMTLGFTDERFCGGFECVLSVDNDAAAMRTHEQAYAAPAVVGNIEDWLQTSPDIPAADIVIGGPPCQGFSLLNKNRTGDGRRALWEPYMDVVEQCGAKMFVMENVPELLRSSEFLDIQSRAISMGFEMIFEVVNTADYGVAQTRKRLIIIGWKKDLIETPELPVKTHSKNPDDRFLHPWRTVKDVIADLPEPEGIQIRDCAPPLNLHFGRTPTEKSLARYKAVPPGGNRFDLQRNAPEITPACWIRKTSGGTDLFGRLWWDRPSVTIRTEFFKPEKGRYLHPEKHRPITHREAARIMGFPDDFPFQGTKIEIARQIGNAVPPLLAGAIAKVVLRVLSAKSEAKAA